MAWVFKFQRSLDKSAFDDVAKWSREIDWAYVRTGFILSTTPRLLSLVRRAHLPPNEPLSLIPRLLAVKQSAYKDLVQRSADRCEHAHALLICAIRLGVLLGGNSLCEEGRRVEERREREGREKMDESRFEGNIEVVKQGLPEIGGEDCFDQGVRWRQLAIGGEVGCSRREEREKGDSPLEGDISVLLEDAVRLGLTQNDCSQEKLGWREYLHNPRVMNPRSASSGFQCRREPGQCSLASYSFASTFPFFFAKYACL